MAVDETNLDAGVTINDSDEPGPFDAPTLPRGSSIGRYLVVDLVGRGGMGVVYKAFDPDLNRPIALKLLTIQKRAQDSSQDLTVHKTRLLREAQALAQLSHPNVVTVHDVGVHQEAVFMAMEFVEGKTLKDLLDEKSHSRSQILEILTAAGRGLAAAHKVGIVHRDFKPANVIIGQDGRARVLDFGLARTAAGEESEAPGGAPIGADTPVSGELERLEREIGQEASGGNLSGATALSERFAVLAKLDTSGSLLKSALTQAGAIVGTPHYMAPEQHLAQAVDDKSDQFAFCVVLFEALYGNRPFSGRSLSEMVAHITQGKIERPAKRSGAAPPKGAAKPAAGGGPFEPVPTWLDRVAVRGLSLDPDERYPSMDALLAELQNDPEIARARVRARRLRWAGVALVLLFTAGGSFGIWYGATRAARICAAGEEKFQGVWDEPVRRAVGQAFDGSGRPYARDTFARVAQTLDGYRGRWLAARRDACEATHLRGEQSEKLLDLRMQCLERRLSEMQALTRLFAAGPDGEVVDKAVQATLELAGLARCADREALEAAVPPPEDPRVRAVVEAVRKRLDAAKALEVAGKYQDGARLAAEILEAAHESGYAPVEAEAALGLGIFQSKSGEAVAGEQTLARALDLAASARDPKVLVTAASELVYVIGYERARYAEALGLGRLVEAMARREAIEASLLASVHANLGVVLWSKGDFEQARRHFESELALYQKASGANHPRVASALNNLANVLFEEGRIGEAQKLYTQALSISRQVQGPDHPDVARDLNNLSTTFTELKQYDRAEETLRQALAIWEKALGPRHPMLAAAANNLGEVYSYQRKFDQAIPYCRQALEIGEASLDPRHPIHAYHLTCLGTALIGTGQRAAGLAALERALAIREANPADPLALADVRFALAKALGTDGPDRVRALALARQVKQAFAAAGEGKQKSLAQVEAWLADHRPR